MGKLLILAKYIFLIYGSDIFEKRKHVHCTYARRGYKKSCKVWLEPTIELDGNKTGDFSDRELREIEQLVEDNKGIILQQLECFYNNEPVKAIRK